MPLDNDAHGSVVSREPAIWMVSFVPAIERQWWHWMLGPMKHCFAMKYEHWHWVIFEPWWSRIMLCSLTEAEAAKFHQWARRGVTLVVREHIPGKSMQMRGWMSCAALIAHLLGRGYWVWTPRQLYKRLVREGNNKPR